MCGIPGEELQTLCYTWKRHKPCLLPVPWCIYEPELPAGKQPGLGKEFIGKEKQQLEVATTVPPVPSALQMIVAASRFHVTSLIVGI